MSGHEGGDVFRWETYRSGNEAPSDWGQYVVVTLGHVLTVGAVTFAAPWAGLVIGGILALFWGVLLVPTWLRERAAVEWAEIRPGLPPTLVLARVSGVETSHHLDSVRRLRLIRTGYRSADNPGGGQRVLELHVGRKVYRTRAAFNPAENDPGLLEEALRRACPGATVAKYKDRTSWVSDSE
ncbi:MULTISPECIES: hypothetical protein [unclassified Kitasatospora]|uniref:hypothetical protein n=1 Tax=unclassified Kitasatospora TaxID=2633591 RepID=UPI00070BEA9A|nr:MULTISPECIES: hypothetical protein [unclassified Kitasatospora]KQV19309.1 hypothetical protein ASC99_24545 [Kitasatospora sp. Root107]KRB77584.1 hypothetical protein ASE03_00740 [Kitasatospora sp. Root187]